MNPSTKKRILLVEDEFLLAVSEKLQLEKYWYDVTTVNSGEKAIEATSGDSSFDLVLMDINLGKGIDGTQAAGIMLKDHDIPIVFLSSHTEPEIVEKTEKITSYGYVVKNSTITVLDASIKMAFKLFDAQKKLEATLDALPDLFLEVGLDGIVSNVHSSFPELLHCTASEMIGLRIPELFPSEVSDTLMSAIREAHEKGSSLGKQYVLDVRSGRRWFEISVSRIANRLIDTRFILLAHDITDRVHAERLVLESRKQYVDLVERTPDLITKVDSDGRILFVNHSSLELFGLEPGECVGRIAFDFIAAEDREDTISAFEMWGRGENEHFKHENTVVGVDGRTHRVMWIIRAERDASGKVVGFESIGRDMTDYARKTKELQESEEKYRDLFNKAEVGMFRSRLDGSEFLESNDKCLSILGMEREESIGKPTSIFWADPAKRDEMVTTLKAEGHIEDLECRLLRRDGKVITCITSLKLYPDSEILEGSIIDITERKELANALQQKEQRLQSIFNAMTEGFSIQEVITDDEGKPIDLRFVDANPAFEAQTGLKNEETLGHTLRELFPTSEQYWIDRYGKVGLTGEPMSFEAQFSPLGKYYHVSAFQTEPRQFGVLFMDVAEVLKAQEARKG